MYLADLLEITQVALQASFFTSLGKVFTQCRGACIGGQASPAICAIVVAFREHMWLTAYQTTISSSQLCIRYVDNRAIMLSPIDEETARFKLLLNMEFYVLPIELEQCGHNILLGFEINMQQLQILFVPPQFQHEYRSPRSAGSTQRILSGLGARLHILHRGTFPRSNIPELVNKLFNVYVLKGFHISTLRKIGFKVAAKFGKATD